MTSMATTFGATSLGELTGENTIHIQANPQRVYAYLADFTRHPEWALNLAKVTPLDSGPVRVGARYKSTESAPPAPLVQKMHSMFHFVRGMISGANSYSEAELTALEPTKHIAWTGRVRKGSGEFNRSLWEFVIEPDGVGTRLTQRFRYQPQTTIAAQMLNAVGGSAGLKAACLKSLLKLKSVLEHNELQK